MAEYTVDVSKPTQDQTGIKFQVFTDAGSIDAHIKFETLGKMIGAVPSSGWVGLVTANPDAIQRLVDSREETETGPLKWMF